MSATPAALACVFIPLAGAVLAWLLPSRARWAGLAVAAGVLVATALVAGGVATAGPVSVVVGAWPAGLGISLRVDGVGAMFLLASALVGLAASVHAWGYFGRDSGFWVLWLLLWAALNGVFITADAFNAYVCLELVGLTAASLVALGGDAPALRAALRYLLVSLVGATAYLAGVALLYLAGGTLELAELRGVAAGPVGAAATGLILAGLGLKAALFPLHGWLAPAHARAPGPVSAILSALVVKAAVFLIWRWHTEVFAPHGRTGDLLALLGGAAVVWGSLQALRVDRLKAIIAYSTVAQIGYLALALGLTETAPEAVVGVAYLALTHALAKGAAFLAAANTRRAAGHDRWPTAAAYLRGRPLNLMAFALAAVSLAGLPPSGGFVAKWYLLQAAAAAGRLDLALALAAGGLLAAAYLYRVIHPGLDPRPPALPRAAPSPLLECSALGLALVSTVLGLAVPWAGLLVAGAAP